jgi:REP element-mobilizing transposase RayT
LTLYRDKYRVESARLQKWDYSSPGYYFVTICASDRKCLFGEINDGTVTLNGFGCIVRDEWLKSFAIRPELKQDEFVVMPNHFHAVAGICDVRGCRDVARNVSTECVDTNYDDVSTNPDAHAKLSAISPKPNSLSAIIRSFKSAVTNRMRGAGFDGDVWQPRFHDHIIRNDRELFAIRQYIKNNPANWDNDNNVVETSEQKTGKQPWFVYMGRL